MHPCPLGSVLLRSIRGRICMAKDTVCAGSESVSLHATLTGPVCGATRSQPPTAIPPRPSGSSSAPIRMLRAPASLGPERQLDARPRTARLDAVDVDTRAPRDAALHGRHGVEA